MQSSAASAVVNVHREGPLLPATLRSILLARERAAAAGHALELLVVADRPDEATRAVLDRFGDRIDRRIEVDCGDLGAARQHGIGAAAHDWVFMHDGDDLYSSNWYLAFFEALAAGRISPRTVYHVEIFARFGELVDLRRMIDSEDPAFHPLFLAADWYFSNKAVAHRSLFAEFPLPRNRIETGLGNEDWTWSCDTIHAGIRHSPLPGTACFYRVKPVGQSLGLTPGMIHGPSPLFAPENVAALARRSADATPGAFAPSLSGAVDPRMTMKLIPHWFWEEVDRQGAFEAMITDFHSLPGREKRLPPPNLNFNVVSATEYLFAGMDARPKVFLFASDAGLRGADIQIEMLLEAAAAHEDGAFQPVLVLEEDELLASDARIEARHGAKVISVRRLTEQFRLDRWFFHRFAMRPLVQYPGSVVIDLGSDIFAGLFAQFHRTILGTMRAVRMVLPDRRLDLMSPPFLNVTRNAVAWHAHTGRPVPLTVMPELGPVFTHGTFARPVFAPAVPDAQTVASLDAAVSRRFRRPPPPRGRIALSALLDAPALQVAPEPAPAPDRHGEVEALSAPGGAVIYTLAGAWVAPEWPRAAAAFLAANPGVGIVGPQITAELTETGRYLHRWHDYARADLVFSGMCERLRRGVRVPLVAMLRAPLDPVPDTGEGLARALYRLARHEGLGAAACETTVAVARETRLYPERTA